MGLALPVGGFDGPLCGVGWPLRGFADAKLVNFLDLGKIGDDFFVNFFFF